MRSGPNTHPTLKSAFEEKSLNRSDLDDMFQSFRDIIADIDFSDLLDGIKE